MIQLLDVILIFDDTLREPHPKMVVCLNALDGWYFRINSRSTLRPCVKLEKNPHHMFLDHDSYLHCDILELDDYVIEQSLRRHAGIIGTIHSSLKPDIISKTFSSAVISSEDKHIIRNVLS